MKIKKDIKPQIKVHNGLNYRSDCAYLERASQIFAAVSLCLLPLIIGKNKYYTLTITKFRWLRGVAWAYIAVTVFFGLCFLVEKKLAEKRRLGGKDKFDVPQLILIAYVLWACVSAVFSEYRADAFWGQSRYEGLYSIFLYAVIFILLSFWGEYTDGYLVSVQIMSVAIGVIGILQYFGHALLFEYGMTYYSDESRFISTVGNPDCMAGIISMALPLLICGFIICDKWWRYFCLPGAAILTFVQCIIDVDSSKVALVGVLAVMLPFILQDFKRISRFSLTAAVCLAAYTVYNNISYSVEEGISTISLSEVIHQWPVKPIGILIVLSGIFFGLSYIKKLPKVKPLYIRLFVLILIAAGVAVVLKWIYSYDGDNLLLKEFSGVLHFELDDQAGAGRGYIWKSCVKLIREKPILGYGPGSFISAFNPYQGTGEASSLVIDFAHNDYIQNAVCQGLTGMALYIAFLLSLFVRFIKNVDKCPVSVMFFAAFVGYAIYSFFAFSIAIVSPFFWIIAGLMDKCIRQARPQII